MKDKPAGRVDASWPGYLLNDLAKETLKFSDRRIGELIGVSRPTLARYKKDPTTMTVRHMLVLERELETIRLILPRPISEYEL